MHSLRPAHWAHSPLPRQLERAAYIVTFLWPSGKVICIELPKRADSSGPLFHSVRAGGEDVAAHRLAES